MKRRFSHVCSQPCFHLWVIHAEGFLFSLCKNLNFTSLAGQTQPLRASCFHPGGLTSCSPAYAASSTTADNGPIREASPAAPTARQDRRMFLLQSWSSGTCWTLSRVGSARHLCGRTPAAVTMLSLGAGWRRDASLTSLPVGTP